MLPDVVVGLLFINGRVSAAFGYGKNRRSVPFSGVLPAFYAKYRPHPLRKTIIFPKIKVNRKLFLYGG